MENLCPKPPRKEVKEEKLGQVIFDGTRGVPSRAMPVFMMLKAGFFDHTFSQDQAQVRSNTRFLHK
jgi:hypothetical protein